MQRLEPRDVINERSRQYRATKLADGFLQFSTHMPKDILNYVDHEKKIRGLATRGHALTALIREQMEYRKTSEETATK